MWDSRRGAWDRCRWEAAGAYKPAVDTATRRAVQETVCSPERREEGKPGCVLRFEMGSQHGRWNPTAPETTCRLIVDKSGPGEEDARVRRTRMGGGELAAAWAGNGDADRDGSRKRKKENKKI